MADSYFRVTNMTQIHTPGLQTLQIHRIILQGYKHETDSYFRVTNMADSYSRVTNMRQIHTPGLQTSQIHTSGLQT